MILCNVEIQKALDEGDLILDPQPEPRMPSLKNAECPYDTTAVNLRLSKLLDFPTKDPQPFSFDLRKGKVASFLKRVYDSDEIDADGGYSLKPDRFILGHTVERITLPMRTGRPVLAARVEGRSSLARCGLLVHFTAPTIHAGFEGTITLEMMNLGKNDIVLFPDMWICQLIIERVEGMPTPNPSQFQAQMTPSGLK
jgi:dCTP deaminase